MSGFYPDFTISPQSTGGDMVERESLGLFASSATQNPTGSGQSSIIQVEFGDGGITANGEFTVASDGTITCNEGGKPYEFEFVLRLERTGLIGVSELMARLMYAPDGNPANAVQVKNTFGVRLNNQNTIWREGVKVDARPVTGSIFFVQLARNPGTVVEAGGIGAFQPTGDLSDWNQINSASIEISRYKVVSS